VRERRGSYSGHVVGCIPSFCWIIERKDLEIYLVDVAHTGEPCIYVSVLYCISSVFYFHIFLFCCFAIMFLQHLGDNIFIYDESHNNRHVCNK
jgi:hypothetical protein